MSRPIVVGVLVAALGAAAALAFYLSRSDEPVDRDVVAVLRASEAPGSEPDELASRVRKLCEGCRVRTEYAGSDADAQARQFRDALAAGADVVILEPVVPERAEELAVSAGPVPVVALGTVVPGASFYAGPHERALGRRLGLAVAEDAPPGPVLVVEPPATAAGMTAGPDGGLGQRERIRLEANPAATREQTRDWVAAQLAVPRPVPIAAAIAVGPAQALGVLEALRGLPAAERPAVATVGDDLDALRRLVRRETTWSAHVDRPAEYDAAARLAASVVTDAPAPETADYQGVPSVLTRPQIITLDNLTETMVRHHGVEISELCDRRTHAACEAAGLL